MDGIYKAKKKGKAALVFDCTVALNWRSELQMQLTEQQTI